MTLVIGRRYRPLLEKPLERMGARVAWMPDNQLIDPRLAAHADLSVFCPDHRHVIVGKGVKHPFVNYLTSEGYLIETTAYQGMKYPEDCGLCVRTTGKYTICHPGTIDHLAERYITGTRIHVRQGYAACAVCAVTEDAIISSDHGIAIKCVEAGLDVLEIRPGSIRLDGFAYGFIGGASLKLKDHEIAFTGLLDNHPDGALIREFLHNRSVRAECLTDGPLFDIGGAAALP